MRLRQIKVPLSKLVAGKANPRRVKPDREAHARLAASIRSMGFFSSLVVLPVGEEGEKFTVIAGNRRLAALREVHKGEAEVSVSCVLVDAENPDALSLAENFAREPMHPLDEAEAFSKLASGDGKDPEAIAADFGVTEHYVRQRIKLASLAPVVKAAYREGKLDTATAEAFAAVPETRQGQVWEELGDNPRHPLHAQQVRNVIARSWIEGGHALFDIATLPEEAVSRDLFGGQVLIERAAFMEAQAAALEAERVSLLEGGWANVVVGRRENLYGQVSAMSFAERVFDAKTVRTLEKLHQRAEALEQQMGELEEGDKEQGEKLGERLDKLHAAAREVVGKAPVQYSEETKGVGTVFLLLDSEGKVEREYRVPRAKHGVNGSGQSGHGGEGDANAVAVESPKPPTSDDLADRQVSAVFTHQTLLVREAVLEDEKVRKRLLAVLLYDRVRKEALAMRHDANGVNLQAAGEGFESAAFARLQEQRNKVDPLEGPVPVTDEQAYEKIAALKPAKLDALIDLLLVNLLTCHPVRGTPLVQVLAKELKVDFRKHWRPDRSWLSAYRKCQLAHLMAELRGPVYSPAHETRKKTELVEVLATLFADAAEGKLEDKALAERVNRWLPVNLREKAAE